MNFTSSTLIIGIDVSSQSNSVFIIDSDGNHITKKAFTINNDIDSASKIISEALAHAVKIGASTIKFGMGATSHYTWHLQLQILSSAELAPFKPLVYTINPYVVRGFKNAFTHLPKTDSIDAMVIAECVRFGKAKPTPLPDFRYAALQRLTRF